MNNQRIILSTKITKDILQFATQQQLEQIILQVAETKFESNTQDKQIAQRIAIICGQILSERAVLRQTQ